jgi:hypothetical protein
MEPLGLATIEPRECKELRCCAVRLRPTAAKDDFGAELGL